MSACVTCPLGGGGGFFTETGREGDCPGLRYPTVVGSIFWPRPAAKPLRSCPFVPTLAAKKAVWLEKEEKATALR